MDIRARWLARSLTWPLVPALAVSTLVVAASSPDTAESLVAPSDAPFLAAILTCWLVGVVLTGRVFRQLAGWAFLGLGTALAWSGFIQVYADSVLVSRPEAWVGRLAATLSDTSFVWWFVFLALVLQLTPDTDAHPPMLRGLWIWTLGTGLTFQVSALLRSQTLDPPYNEVSSPWAVATLSVPMQVVSAVSIAATGVCLIVSGVGLVRAWRRSGGPVRQQLLWLVAGTLPVVPCVVAAFALSYVGQEDIAGYLMSVAIVTVAVGAALSVLRYRLYDVERVVTDSAAYAIASATVTLTFVTVVVVVGRTTPIDSASQLPTIVATLAGAAAARVSYGWGRRAVDRRMNQDRFDAVEAARVRLDVPVPDLDDLLPAVLDDPDARVLYPAHSGAWVTADGHETTLSSTTVDVVRRGEVTAKIEYDPARNDPSVIEAVAREAAAEIDNVALRAELARQVEVITESRSRITAAHLHERRRIERDLHDGAQQRLLAIALHLQSAQLNGGNDVLRAEVDRAVVDLGLTVQELRELAGGLQPAALAGGGLHAAVIDLVGRIPLAITHEVVDTRFPTSIEGAAWFVIAEAVANAVKHADVEQLSISVATRGPVLRVVVADRGRGGADPRGQGLRGLSDRVTALRGSLRVRENPPHGTVVEAELPCGS